VAVEGMHRLFDFTTCSLNKSPYSEKEVQYSDVNLLAQDTTSTVCRYAKIVKIFALIICANNYKLYCPYQTINCMVS
jgi:hypothetical protein